MRAGTFVGLVALVALVAASTADGMTRQRLIERATTICTNADRAMQPSDDRANRAAKNGNWDRFVRYARKGIRIAAPYVRRLADLDPPRRGRTHYRNFIEETRTFVGWFKAMVDAIDARRSRELVTRRARKSRRHRRLAQRAARAYPLPACAKMLAAD